MLQKYATSIGVLQEVDSTRGGTPPPQWKPRLPGDPMLQVPIPRRLIEMVQESVVRDNVVLPDATDGETVTFVSCRAEDISLADKLRFLIAMKVKLIAGSEDQIRAAIDKHYGRGETESVDSCLMEFDDDAHIYSMSTPAESLESHPRERAPLYGVPPRSASWTTARLGRTIKALPPTEAIEDSSNLGGKGLYFCVVDEGQRVLKRRPNGTMEI